MTDASPRAIDDLALVTTPEQQSAGTHLLHVADGWQQGRGAFGGLLLGAMVRAIQTSEVEKERTVRSVNAEIAGPVLPGEATIEVAALRRGSGLSTWNATLSQQGQTLVRLSAVLARARAEDAPKSSLEAPRLTPWSEVAVLPMAGPFVPIFTHHLEFRPTGPLPFSGTSEAVASGWVRPKRTPATVGAPEIVALADAWWPAALAASAVPRPLGTVGFALQLFAPKTALDPAAPLYHRARVVAEQEGFFAEFRELWSPDGQLVALNQQTIAWIR